MLSHRALAPSPRELTGAARAVELACTRVSGPDAHAELLTTAYLPDQQRWLMFCIATSESVVREVAATAQLPDVSVSEV